MMLNHFVQDVDACSPLFSVHSLSYAHLSITNGFYLVLASAAIALQSCDIAAFGS
jgi:hypothetical protein